jgi:hypothetical protein
VEYRVADNAVILAQVNGLRQQRSEQIVPAIGQTSLPKQLSDGIMSPG